MEKLVVCLMGQDCERTIDMCLESVKDADAIVYCDGGSTDGTIELVGKTNPDVEYISNKYDPEDKAMNGKQRNFYLKYLKKNYPDHWALCLDADEVVEDLSKIKEYIQDYTAGGICNVHMRHFIGDLGHEDSTVPKHYVLNRLFRIDRVGEYPEVEHPVLQPNIPISSFNCNSTTIWHLAYVPNMWDIKKRYDSHLAKSNMHTPEFLKQWYYSHLFGVYPKTQINPTDIPKVILDNFGVNKDEFYFANRGLEVKHFIDARDWKDFFKVDRAVEFGCGRGPRVYALNSVGLKTVGFEISQFAVDNSFCSGVIRGNVLEDSDNRKNNLTSGLVIAYDLLEHIRYKDLDTAINTLIDNSSKYILISVPTIGDPNLEADSTHIIKETKEWWIEKFINKGLKQVEVPPHFLFREQLMIFEKPKGLYTSDV